MYVHVTRVSLLVGACVCIHAAFKWVKTGHGCVRRPRTRGSRVLQGGCRQGDFQRRGTTASNHMSRKGGSSGSRPGLGGNQQHMNHILGGGGGGMKEQRGGGWKGFLSELCKC